METAGGFGGGGEEALPPSRDARAGSTLARQGALLLLPPPLPARFTHTPPRAMVVSRHVAARPRAGLALKGAGSGTAAAAAAGGGSVMGRSGPGCRRGLFPVAGRGSQKGRLPPAAEGCPPPAGRGNPVPVVLVRVPSPPPRPGVSPRSALSRRDAGGKWRLRRGFAGVGIPPIARPL